MEIFERRAEWERDFRSRWLTHLEATGEADFAKRYRYVKNAEAPSGPPIDPRRSRLLFVTTSGAYLRGEQTPFDAASPLGDDRVQTFPMSAGLERFGFAHEHYDHQYVNADPQVVLPLRHLEDFEREGGVGSWAEQGVSFSGYLPDATRVVDRMIPEIMEIARAQKVQGALLVPV